MYAITGATGQLGRLVIDALLEVVPAQQIIAAVRSPGKAEDLAAKGVQVRHADYTVPETLVSAFSGVSRLLLISANEVGVRLPQHQAVIDAAVASSVQLLAYTSMLHADRSPAKLAVEHYATERAIAASGLPAVILRNGWYTENTLMGLPAALAHGVMVGAAGNGRFSAAAREDFARAAALVLAAEGQEGKVYELAGDNTFTLSELAAEVSRQAGKTVVYRNLSQADYERVLVDAGLPAALASALADEDAVSAGDTLFDGDRVLSRLISRPTTPFAETVAAALKAQAG